MKLFLITIIAAPIADLFANNGKLMSMCVAYLAAAGHAIAGLGSSIIPSMG